MIDLAEFGDCRCWHKPRDHTRVLTTEEAIAYLGGKFINDWGQIPCTKCGCPGYRDSTEIGQKRLI